ncbi:MAG TPA: 30S ribosomal protein S16 [Candidatus Hydrogenedentes bacterium]|nr:30S ribosomal protein S16 [Candidatus Hydrogenedentota bacterium]HIJ73223.1 30S ribosomal protein S16 [Candidatus Hydrogenedentota bacterium]
MATAIRLKRGGRAHAPYYRVVVMDSRKRNRGRILDEIGVYQPCARPEPLIEIDAARALDWLGKGAQPTQTVRNVLSKKGILAALAEGKTAEDLERGPAAPAPAAAETETSPPETKDNLDAAQ